MLYTEEAVKANVRNREGKRVFFLNRGDTLTPGAKDWLRNEKIEILPGETAAIKEYRLVNGGYVSEKPEHMTHLHGNVLVEKTHPRIVFRGALDALEAELLLCQLAVPEKGKALGELLDLSREILRCEVLEEPLKGEKLLGLTARELRERSHFPQNYYGQTHFMPDHGDGEAILRLNKLRTLVRETERLAVDAFLDREGRLTREDIPRALNRMSSAVYILMIQIKKER